MCTRPKITSVQPAETEVIKTATQADASVQKSNAQAKQGAQGFISENIKTTNNGIDEEITSSKKKLLGE